MKTLSRTGVATGTWKVDQAHSRVGFAVRYMGVATVHGVFREFDGALEIGEDLADTPRTAGSSRPPSIPIMPNAMSTCARPSSCPPRAIPR